MYRSIFFALALPLLCGPSPLSAQQPLRPPQIAPFGDSEWGYLAAKVFAEALRRAGRSPSRDALINALESIQDASFGGFNVSFGPRDHVASRFVDVSMLTEDGKVLR
jgi:hypothetical protein